MLRRSDKLLFELEDIIRDGGSRIPENLRDRLMCFAVEMGETKLYPNQYRFSRALDAVSYVFDLQAFLMLTPTEDLEREAQRQDVRGD